MALGESCRLFAFFRPAAGKQLCCRTHCRKLQHGHVLKYWIAQYAARKLTPHKQCVPYTTRLPLLLEGLVLEAHLMPTQISQHLQSLKHDVTVVPIHAPLLGQLLYAEIPTHCRDH